MARHQQRGAAQRPAAHLMNKVLIVGLGQIGMGYDLELSPDAFALTHARAFGTHPAFRLAGGVDPLSQRCELFEKHYACHAGTDLAAALVETSPDVVIIASPTSQHGAVLHAVLEQSKPRLILCEKPLSFDIDEARSMVAACKAHDCLLYVNYMRRSEPGAIEVKRRLVGGLIDTPIKGVAWYSKGLFNNGSHFFNLLELWLGCMTGFKIIEPGRTWDGIDPEPDVQVTFEQGTVCFLAARDEYFSHHEIDLVAPNGRLRYEQGGGRIVWQAARVDPTFEGYTVLSSAGELIESEGIRSQWHVVNQLAACLAGRPANVCCGAVALQTLESLTAITAKI